VRPVMAGVGYTLGHGRALTNFSLVAGYAFTRAKVTTALPSGMGATIDVSNAWVVRPNVGVTYALKRRLALVGSIGYVFTNPTITVDVTQPGQAPIRVSGAVRSDYFNISVGMAVSIF
jgi:outer membrane protein W